MRPWSERRDAMLRVVSRYDQAFRHAPTLAARSYLWHHNKRAAAMYASGNLHGCRMFPGAEPHDSISTYGRPGAGWLGLHPVGFDRAVFRTGEWFSDGYIFREQRCSRRC
jgi:hypothetical protein